MAGSSSGQCCQIRVPVGNSSEMEYCMGCFYALTDYSTNHQIMSPLGWIALFEWKVASSIIYQFPEEPIHRKLVSTNDAKW